MKHLSRIYFYSTQLIQTNKYLMKNFKQNSSNGYAQKQ